MAQNMSQKVLIVIVEDDKFLRELITRKLVQEGYEISDAIDGEEGIEKIKKEKPKLILLDLILPGIDGFNVLSQLKGNAELSNIPVIILSNLGQREDVEKGLKLGAVDYLIKAHFTPGEIVEKIRKTLKTDDKQPEPKQPKPKRPEPKQPKPKQPEPNKGA